MKEIKWPVEYSKEILLGNLSKSVAVCSLWSEREWTGGKVGLNNVALVGNLYSHGPGIEGIIRNVLANPSIRTIVVVGKDKTQSAETLKTFSLSGVKKTDIGWTIDLPDGMTVETLSAGKRSFDSAIPFDAIENLRANVEIVDLRNKNWEGIQDHILQVKHKSSFAEPLVYPKTESKVEILSGEDIGFVFRGSDYHKVWLEILRTIRQFGSKAESRYTNNTQEILNVTAVLDGPTDDVTDDVRKYATSLISGISLDSDDTYNYGQRMRFRRGDQIERVISQLKNKPKDRGILVDLWDVDSDFLIDNANPPCMTQVWFRVFKEKLTANFYYRSHDIGSAWIKNALGDRLLQEYVAKEAGIPLGATSIISGSVHIYENDFQQIDAILKGNPNKWEFAEDPRGNIVVIVENGIIQVRHENSSGAVNLLKGKSGERLYKQIWQKGLISRVDHALYIGHVLTRAEESIKNKTSFDQDKA